MYDTVDIPTIPDQEERLSEVTVDCYGQAEELAAMEVYFTDAVHFPFAATWRDPDEPGHAEPVTVLGGRPRGRAAGRAAARAAGRQGAPGAGRAGVGHERKERQRDGAE